MAGVCDGGGRVEMKPVNILVLSVPQRFELSIFDPFNSDVAVLAIIDFALGIVLVAMLVAFVKLYRKLAQSQSETIQFQTGLSPPSFSVALAKVRKMMSEGMVREAVVTEFPEILDSAVKMDGAKVDASFTAYEIINHGLAKIGKEPKEALIMLYHVYEPIRFGNASPSQEEASKFLVALGRLVEAEGVAA